MRTRSASVRHRGNSWSATSRCGRVVACVSLLDAPARSAHRESSGGREMRFGLALPNKVVGSPRADLAGSAERAERHGFDSIWALDRLVYDSYLPLPLLA